MAVTVTQLVAFLTVARRGSVTAAAKELVVTQPSVSAAINALQRELGVTLMERDGRNLRPTTAGQAYVPYAAQVLGLLERGARIAREARSSGATRCSPAVVTAPIRSVCSASLAASRAIRAPRSSSPSTWAA